LAAVRPARGPVVRVAAVVGATAQVQRRLRE